jgi:signal transduction histidine kinase
MNKPNIQLVDPMSGSSTEFASSSNGAGSGTHIVQFYENDHFLTAAVADFLAAGAAAAQPILVVADTLHREALIFRLKAKGFDTERAIRTGQMVVLDARETLATFMVDSMPNADRFHEIVGGALSNLTSGSALPTVRAYGEMVDVLWKEGNTAGAIELEKLWNQLAETHSFSLLCAYAMGNFYNEAQSADFESVCRHHSHVIPSESYTQATDEQRLIEVSLLQQRARALESEIAHRKDLESRLRVALEEAEEANRVKSRFLSRMSHELRTPLNAIGGHVQLIELGIHGPVTEAQHEALARVQSSQRHLLSMINDVLNVTRSRHSGIIVDVHDIDACDLVQNAVAMIDPLIANNQLDRRVIFVDCDSPLMIRADQPRAQQILLNLLTNAIKFTLPGGSITIEVSSKKPDEAVAVIRVSDTGIGIASEQIDRIFEPFVQLLDATPGGQEGLGLGLAISRDLARAMGGDLLAFSEKGIGTTFELTLPLSEDVPDSLILGAQHPN